MKKILIVKLSSFGDQIHVCPAVSDLKSQRPETEIHWLVQSEFAAVPKAHGAVSSVLSLPLTLLKKNPFEIGLWKDFFRVIQKLRRQRYDAVIDVHGVIKSAVMAMLSGARLRIGYGSMGAAERFATYFYHLHFNHKPGLTSVAKLRQFFAWAFHLNEELRPSNFGLSSAQHPKTTFSGGVLFVPFASQGNKTLTSDFWLTLASKLYDVDPSIQINISWGSEEEGLQAKKLQLLSMERMRSNVKRLESEELLSSILKYDFVVGVDTGITHLANALGVPTVILFRATAPEFYFEKGSAYSISFGSLKAPPNLESVVDYSVGLIKELKNESQRIFT